MKRLTAAALAAIMATVALTGCGASQTPSLIDSEISDQNTSNSVTESVATTASTVDTTSSEPVESDASSATDTASVATTESDPETNSDSPAPSAQTDKPALTTVATLTKLAEPETKPVEQWPELPDNYTFFHEVGAKIRNADSFEIHETMTGIADGSMYESAPIRLSDVAQGKFEHEYILAVSGNNVYVNSTFTDIGAGTDTDIYEGYKTINGDKIETIYRKDNKWISDSSEQTDSTMTNAVLDSYGLLRFLASDYVFGDDGAYGWTDNDLHACELVRQENGDIVITLPDYTKALCNLFDNEICVNATGLMQNPNKNEALSMDYGDHEKLPIQYTSDLTYTFDKDYNIKSISFTWFTSSNRTDTTKHSHINVLLEFSNFNNLAPITVPDYEIVEPEATTES
jgi:hypothetical protein